MTCIGHRGGQPCDREASREYLCERCRLKLRSAIGRMPAHLVLASAEVGRETGTKGVTRTSGEATLPGQWWLELTGHTTGVSGLSRADKVAIQDAASLAEPASAVLSTWARLVIEERPARPPAFDIDMCATCHQPLHRHMRRPTPLSALHPFVPLANSLHELHVLCRWWDTQADFAASQPWADEWQREVNDASYALIRAAGMHRDVRKLGDLCPNCQAAGVLKRYGPRRPGASVLIACDREGGCGSVMTEEEHERWKDYQDATRKAEAA